MGFEQQDSIENPQQSADPKADASAKALAEITPPVPGTSTASGGDDGPARKKEHKKPETFTSAVYPGQSAQPGGILDFANNTVIPQPVRENTKLKLASSSGTDGQQQIVSATTQTARVDAGKSDPDADKRQRFDDKKDTFVQSTQAVRIDHSQSYASSTSRLEPNSWAADAGSGGANVVRGTVRPMGDVLRTDSMVSASSYPEKDQVKKVNEQTGSVTYSDSYTRSIDKMKEGYAYSQPEYRGNDPSVVLANRANLEREAFTAQRDMRTLAERPGGVDPMITRFDDKKNPVGDFTPTFNNNKSMVGTDRLASLDPSSRLDGMREGLRTNPGPGPSVDWNNPKLGKENGGQPSDGRSVSDPDRGRGPGGDPTHLVDKLPNGQGPNDLSRQGPTDLGRQVTADLDKQKDTGRGPTGPGPSEQARLVNSDQNRNPEPNRGPEPTRLAREERPAPTENVPGPQRPGNQPNPVVTGPEGQRPVELVKALPNIDSEHRGQEGPGPKLPQTEIRRQEGLNPEPIIRLVTGPVSPIHIEQREGTGPQTLPDKLLVKVDRKEEEQVGRPRNPVGPGTLPVMENGPEIRLAMIQLPFRPTLDRTATPGDPSVIPMSVKPTLPTDGTRADVRPLISPDAQGVRPLLDVNGVKPVALTPGLLPNALNPEGRIGPVAQQNQGDAGKQVVPGRLDGLDPRIIKTDATTTSGIAKPGETAVKTDGTGAIRPVGADALTNGAVKADLTQVPGRVVDTGAHGVRAGEVGTPHRLPGELTGVAGQHGIDGLNGRLPGKLTGSIEDIDALSGRATRSGLVSQVVSLTDRRTLTGKLNAEDSLDGGKDGLQPKDRLNGGAKRYMTGAEIALAAVLAAGGIRRIRGKGRVKSERAEDESLDQLPALELHGESESVTGETWFSMSTMRKMDRIAHGELQKSRSDQVLKRPTYLVGRHDTLNSIAERLYEDEDLGWLIADVNAGAIKESMVNGKRVVELQDRQQIDLPVWEDIADFYELRPEGANAKNLVTIVSASHMSSEIVDLMLAPVMGGASQSVDPFGRAAAAQRQSAGTDAPVTAVARTASAAPSPAASALSVQQLGQHLSQVAAALNPFPNHWPKPPAAMTGDMTAQERHA